TEPPVVTRMPKPPATTWVVVRFRSSASRWSRSHSLGMPRRCLSSRSRRVTQLAEAAPCVDAKNREGECDQNNQVEVRHFNSSFVVSGTTLSRDQLKVTISRTPPVLRDRMRLPPSNAQ